MKLILFLNIFTVLIINSDVNDRERFLFLKSNMSEGLNLHWPVFTRCVLVTECVGQVKRTNGTQLSFSLFVAREENATSLLVEGDFAGCYAATSVFTCWLWEIDDPTNHPTSLVLLEFAKWLAVFFETEAASWATFHSEVQTGLAPSVPHPVHTN